MMTPIEINRLGDQALMDALLNPTTLEPLLGSPALPSPPRSLILPMMRGYQ